MNIRDIVPAEQASAGAVPYEAALSSPGMPDLIPETEADAAAQGDIEAMQFWDRQIRAALLFERRWRLEAQAAERLQFGPDDDPGQTSPEEAAAMNKINDKVGLIHANIEVLKPLLYSETPQPIVRRRFMGDGTPLDHADVMVAEVGQRMALYLLDTEDFDGAMERARDDWLVAGRGVVRVIYKAEFEEAEQVDPATGNAVTVTRKSDERVCPRSMEWRRALFAPTEAWASLPWMAFETPMTRTAIRKRFGPEKADRFTFNGKGLADSDRGPSDTDENRDRLAPLDESGKPAVSPFDTAMVWEIWNKEEGCVVWYSPSYKHGILDRQPDALALEQFYPCAKPLLATVKGDRLTPRPDIAYYQDRAEEVRIASKKLRSILDVLSISGLFPGAMQDDVKKLLSGENLMIPVESWLKLMDKGGTANVIQWLPIQHMVAAAQALVLMREQAKQAMYEASGVSDIMRSQGDPDETATAQNLKGQYAGLRLKSRQSRMAHFARDTLRLMLEIAFEHFDTARLAAITGIDLPMTEADREAMMAANQVATQAFEAAMQQHQAQMQAVQGAAQQVGQAPPEVQQKAGPVIQQAAQAVGAPPQPPQLIEVPGTSWEVVHAKLKSDFGRKISLTIETQSTILTDEAQDKDARVEFIQAFAGFVTALAPMMASGVVDLKMVKELLLFGVRGFPKSRTIESMIASLPDEAPPKQDQEPVQVTVANIRAEVDKMLEEMRMADAERDRQHETKLKGLELLAESARMKNEADATPPPTPPEPKDDKA
jgi:hypothetical protein